MDDDCWLLVFGAVYDVLDTISLSSVNRQLYRLSIARKLVRRGHKSDAFIFYEYLTNGNTILYHGIYSHDSYIEYYQLGILIDSYLQNYTGIKYYITPLLIANKITTINIINGKIKTITNKYISKYYIGPLDKIDNLIAVFSDYLYYKHDKLIYKVTYSGLRDRYLYIKCFKRSQISVYNIIDQKVCLRTYNILDFIKNIMHRSDTDCIIKLNGQYYGINKKSVCHL